MHSFSKNAGEGLVAEVMRGRMQHFLEVAVFEDDGNGERGSLEVCRVNSQAAGAQRGFGVMANSTHRTTNRWRAGDNGEVKCADVAGRLSDRRHKERFSGSQLQLVVERRTRRRRHLLSER